MNNDNDDMIYAYMYMEKPLPFKDIITLRFVCIMILALYIYIHDAERMAYDSRSYDHQIDIELNHIEQEDGKEPIYTLSSYYNESLKIPESTYKEFIGDGNKTITIHKEELSFYIANARFGFSFDDATCYSLSRYSYPWEEPAKAFSEKEIKEAAELFVDNPSESSLSDLLREDIRDYTSRGHDFTNPLDGGAKMLTTILEKH